MAPRFRRWPYVFCVTALAMFVLGVPLSAQRNSSFRATAMLATPAAIRVAESDLVHDLMRSVVEDRAILAEVESPANVQRVLASMGLDGSSRLAVRVERVPQNSPGEPLPWRHELLVAADDEETARRVARGLARDLGERFQRAVERIVASALAELHESARFAKQSHDEAESRQRAIAAELASAGSTGPVISFPDKQPAIAPPTNDSWSITVPNKSGPANRAPPKTVAPVLTRNPQWQSLQRELDSVELERTQLLARYTPEHPLIRHLDQRRTDLQQQLAATPQMVDRDPTVEPATTLPPSELRTPQPPRDASSAAKTAKRDADAAGDDLAAARRSALETQLAEATEQLGRLASAHRAAAEDVAVVETRLASIRHSGWDVAAIATAIAQRQTARIPWRLLLAASCVTGVVIAFAAAGLRPTFETVEELRRAVDVPIVGVIPPAEGGAPPPRWGRRLAASVAGCCEVALTLAAGLLIVAAIRHHQDTGNVRLDPLEVLASPAQWWHGTSRGV